MSDTGSTTYANIVVSWKATKAPTLQVEIKAGGALIGHMDFNPYSLNNTLKYANPSQKADGIFTVQFDAAGTSGTLTCQDFSWDLTSGRGGPVTGIVGIWAIT